MQQQNKFKANKVWIFLACLFLSSFLFFNKSPFSPQETLSISSSGSSGSGGISSSSSSSGGNTGTPCIGGKCCWGATCASASVLYMSTCPPGSTCTGGSASSSGGKTSSSSSGGLIPCINGYCDNHAGDCKPGLKFGAGLCPTGYTCAPSCGTVSCISTNTYYCSVSSSCNLDTCGKTTCAPCSNDCDQTTGKCATDPCTNTDGSKKQCGQFDVNGKTKTCGTCSWLTPVCGSDYKCIVKDPFCFPPRPTCGTQKTGISDSKYVDCGLCPKGEKCGGYLCENACSIPVGGEIGFSRDCGTAKDDFGNDVSCGKCPVDEPYCNAQQNCIDKPCSIFTAYGTPIAQQCGNSTDNYGNTISCGTCSGSNPICLIGKCVGCLSNSDCKFPDKICTPDHKCIECDDGNICPDGSACGDTNRCECTTDSCKTNTDPTKKRCNGRICVECLGTNDCLYSHNEAPFPKKICNTDELCVECSGNSDCSKWYNGKTYSYVCKSGSCIGCTTNKDCGAGYSCDSNGNCNFIQTSFNSRVFNWLKESIASIHDAFFGFIRFR